jgi:hypothetical protein
MMNHPGIITNITINDRNEIDVKSGEDGMLLHYVLYGGKIAHGLKLTPHSIKY